MISFQKGLDYFYVYQIFTKIYSNIFFIILYKRKKIIHWAIFQSLNIEGKYNFIP